MADHVNNAQSVNIDDEFSQSEPVDNTFQIVPRMNPNKKQAA
jgi:hypothetical protein